MGTGELEQSRVYSFMMFSLLKIYIFNYIAIGLVRLVQTALETYGKVDIVIANAGILRDKTFARISPQDWDSVHATHLRGSFLTVQASSDWLIRFQNCDWLTFAGSLASS